MEKFNIFYIPQALGSSFQYFFLPIVFTISVNDITIHSVTQAKIPEAVLVFCLSVTIHTQSLQADLVSTTSKSYPGMNYSSTPAMLLFSSKSPSPLCWVNRSVLPVPHLVYSQWNSRTLALALFSLPEMLSYKYVWLAPSPSFKHHFLHAALSACTYKIALY